jgi:hypothetical protein
MERGRVIAAAEVVLAAAVVIGHNVFRAVPNEVPVLLLVAIVSVILRRQSPRSIGFVRPWSWRRTVSLAAATAVALQLVSTATITRARRAWSTAASPDWLLGTLYVRNGHNLWPTILTHGLTDTIALAIIATGLVRV